MRIDHSFVMEAKESIMKVSLIISRWMLLLLFASALTPSIIAQSKGSILSFQGEVVFLSDAPQEKISARSDELRGMIDTLRNTFAFQIPAKSFEGFNSDLQRQHFNENYMESHRYPNISYSGKILGEIDYDQIGTYDVKTKGNFSIHGREQEEIISNQVIVSENEIRIESTFNIRLSQYDIRIPRIVEKKISPEIEIQLTVTNTKAT